MFIDTCTCCNSNYIKQKKQWLKQVEKDLDFPKRDLMIQYLKLSIYYDKKATSAFDVDLKDARNELVALESQLSAEINLLE